MQIYNLHPKNRRAESWKGRKQPTYSCFTRSVSTVQQKDEKKNRRRVCTPGRFSKVSINGSNLNTIFSFYFLLYTFFFSFFFYFFYFLFPLFLSFFSSFLYSYFCFDFSFPCFLFFFFFPFRLRFAFLFLMIFFSFFSPTKYKVKVPLKVNERNIV